MMITILKLPTTHAPQSMAVRALTISAILPQHVLFTNNHITATQLTTTVIAISNTNQSSAANTQPLPVQFLTSPGTITTALPVIHTLAITACIKLIISTKKRSNFTTSLFLIYLLSKLGNLIPMTVSNKICELFVVCKIPFKVFLNVLFRVVQRIKVNT